MAPIAIATEQITIEVDELRERLDRHEPPTILDLRARADRDEWSIPGSVHVDVYRALSDRDVHALDDVEIPIGSEIVTVCGAGKAAGFATELLRARGLVARTLVGGMKAWSLAWNTAETPIPGSEATVIQIRRTGKGCLSYLIGSGTEAVVIDASLGPDVYLNLAAEKGWNITHVLDTHVHADHLSRSRLLAEASGGAYYAPITDRLAFAFEPLTDRDVIAFGWSRLLAIATPGHTAESMTYMLDGRALFTGDTLFLEGVGRPDLDAGAGEAHDRARQLWTSLQIIKGCADGTLILPGHASRPIPFDDEPLTATLGAIRRRVALLDVAEAKFVEIILARIPPTPPNYAEIVTVNESGRFLNGDPTDLEAGANRCAIA